MELIEDFIIDCNVVIPEELFIDGSVRVNSIDCGVAIIVVNGEEMPTVDGKVYLTIPYKTSELENDANFTSMDTVTEMISTALTGYQEKLYVSDDILVVPE